MVAEALAEGGHVVVAALARVVRRVEADAQVEAHHQEVQIVAQAETRAQSQLLAQVGEAERAALTSATLHIGMRKVDLHALDRAYSIAFPQATPINVNKKRSKK